ncbi:uncharacterized protein LOC117646975 [Thrips palmi]|uniref:Uncharacterized protein LOC117646975 n=1 Tax=Thrips palmi TaxID=161013 RepID=A0A6P8Z3K2_THRPL|nr:uncharacterized protein LOC117646975 [Thrips palmi]
MGAKRNGFVAAVCVAFLAGGVPGVRCEEEQKAEEQHGVRGCTFRGRAYAVGERWATGPPDKCAKYLCEDDDQIAALTCPWFIPAPGCTVSPGDEDAVYPGCCPLRKCHHPAEDAVNATKEDAVKEDAVKEGAGKEDAVKGPSRNTFRVRLGGDEAPRMAMATTAATTTDAVTEATTMATTTEAVTEEVEAVTEGGPLEAATVTSTMVPPP